MASRTEVAPAATEGGRSGFLPDRIIHLHPTRLCNLACLHCYSESGPHQRGALDLGTVTSGLEVLRAEGYKVVSLSGGEPLVYRDIGAVVGAAKALGFRVTMITNGLLVSGRNAAVVAELDGMAVSFDGLPKLTTIVGEAGGIQPSLRRATAARGRRPAGGRGDFADARRDPRAARPGLPPGRTRRAGAPDPSRCTRRPGEVDVTERIRERG